MYSQSLSPDQSVTLLSWKGVVSGELCDRSVRFEGARSRISQKYDDVERRLIERFVSAQKRDDRDAMKEVATVMAQFKGFSQCVDAFIEQSQMVSGRGRRPARSQNKVQSYDSQE